MTPEQWAPILSMALTSAGSAMNANAAANTAINYGAASVEDMRQQLAFNREQMGERQTYERDLMNDRLGFELGELQSGIDFQRQSLTDLLAMEQRNLEAQIRVAEENRARALQTGQENLGRMQGSLDAQAAAIAAEQARQQAFSRGGATALDESIGLYGDFGGQLDQRQEALAQAMIGAMSDGGAGGVVPAANNEAVAAREAAMRAQARASAEQSARNRAGVEAFGDLMGDIGVSQNRNSQIADIIRNFAQGSRSVLPAEVGSESMYFQAEPIQQAGAVQERFIDPGDYISERFINPGDYIGQNYINNPMPSRVPNTLLGDLLQFGGSLVTMNETMKRNAQQDKINSALLGRLGYDD